MGLVAGWALFFLVVLALDLREIGVLTVPFLPLVVAGTGVATAQWRVLRHQVAPARFWVLANVAGWSLGALLAVAVGRSVATTVDSAMSSISDDSLGTSVGLWGGGAALGAVVGGTQWLLLRRHAAGSGGLLPASAVAMAVNLFIYDIFLRLAGFVGLLAFVVVGGVILGAMTARPLHRALSQHPSR